MGPFDRITSLVATIRNHRGDESGYGVDQNNDWDFTTNFNLKYIEDYGKAIFIRGKKEQVS